MAEMRTKNAPSTAYHAAWQLCSHKTMPTNGQERANWRSSQAIVQVDTNDIDRLSFPLMWITKT